MSCVTVRSSAPNSSTSFFLRVFSFLGWYNHVHFWTSHQEHHKYTLHPPDDLEVVLPVEITRKSFYKAAVINPWGLVQRIKGVVGLSFGRLEGEWESFLFPPDEKENARAYSTGPEFSCLAIYC